jgi:hypothetical protein
MRLMNLAFGWEHLFALSCSWIPSYGWAVGIIMRPDGEEMIYEGRNERYHYSFL